MVDPHTVTLQSQVAELSEELVVLKTQISDERWRGIAQSLEQANENFRVLNDRIDRIDAVVRGISQGRQRSGTVGEPVEERGHD